MSTIQMSQVLEMINRGGWSLFSGTAFNTASTPKCLITRAEAKENILFFYHDDNELLVLSMNGRTIDMDDEPFTQSIKFLGPVYVCDLCDQRTSSDDEKMRLAHKNGLILALYNESAHKQNMQERNRLREEASAARQVAFATKRRQVEEQKAANIIDFLSALNNEHMGSKLVSVMADEFSVKFTFDSGIVTVSMDSNGLYHLLLSGSRESLNLTYGSITNNMVEDVY